MHTITIIRLFIRVLVSPPRRTFHLLLTTVLLAMLALTATTSSPTLAAAKTWDGDGSTNDWSEDANWDPDGAPATSDSVTFDGTSSQNVTVDINVTIAGLTIASGYSGTITQGSSSLTINGDFSQAGGTFTGGSATVDVNGAFSLTGGTFTSTSGKLQVSGNFTHSGGTFNHNSGTVRLDSNSGTQIVSGTISFYDLTLDNSGATTDLGTSSITIDHNLRADGGTMEEGTSTITFTSSAGAIAGGNTKRFYNLVVNSGANIAHTTGGNLEIYHDFTNNGDFESTRTILFRKPGSSSAVHNLAGSGNTTFGEIVIQGSNTLNAGSHDFAITGDTFQVSSSGTFNGGTATVTFGGSTTLAGAGTINFNGVTINAANSLINNTNNKDFSVSGDWTNNGTYTAGTETVTFNGSGTQNIAGTTVFSNLTVNNGSALRLAANANLGYAGTFTLNGTFDATSNSPTTVTIAGSTPQTLPAGATTLRNLTINSGASLTAPAGTLSIAGNLTNSGTFTHNSGTVTFNGSGAQALSGPMAFHNLTINNTAGTPGDTTDVAPDTALTVANTLNVNDGQFQPPTGSTFKDVTIGSDGILKPDNGASISISGHWSNSGTFTHNASQVTFDGGTTQNLTANVLTQFKDLDITSGTILVEIVSADNITVTGALTNSGRIRKEQPVLGTGTRTFGLTGVEMNVTSRGSLSNLRVERIDAAHPNAPGSIQTDKYWSFTPTGSGFSIDVVLPHGLADHTRALVCRYTGSGTTWDCARTSSNATTVTRSGLTQLSDWAVGVGAPPEKTNPVGGVMFIAASPMSKLMLLAPWLVGVVGLLMLVVRASWVLRRWHL